MNPQELISSEYDDQCSIFQFCQVMSKQYPELDLCNGSLNGVRLSIGQAVKAKNAGMKRGYPDIFLPVARGKWHGLFIELKRTKGGQVSPEQKRWLKSLEGQGYYACVCKGAEVAKRILVQYLRGEL